MARPRKTPTPPPGSTPAKLLDIRKARKWSQGEIAEIMGVNPKTYANWERGDRAASPTALRKLSNAIGTDIGWLLSTDDSPMPIRGAGSPLQELSKSSDPITSALIFGQKCMIRQWRGANAGSREEDSSFDLIPEEAYAVWGFLVDGRPDVHDAFRVVGDSMSPRIEHGDRVIIRWEPSPPYGAIVAAQSPEGRVYLKVFVRSAGGHELRSINPAFAPITKPEGWTCKGYAVAIVKDPDGSRGFSLEWMEGLPLRP